MPLPHPCKFQQRTHPHIYLGSALLFLATGAGLAQSSNYSLKILAQTGDLVDGQPLTATVNPAINDLGTAVYLGAFQNSDDTVSISSAGNFYRNTPLQSKLLIADGTTIGNQTVCGFSHIAVNDRGTVAFEVVSYNDPNAGCENSEVYTTPDNSPGKFTLLASSGDIIDGTPLQDLVLYGFNDQNTAVILADSNIITAQASRGDTRSFEIAQAGIGRVIAGKKLTDFGSVPTLNDSGVVSFIGYFKGGTGIFTQHSLLAQTGEAIDGQTLNSFASIPQINDFGTVAFLAGIRDPNNAGQVGVFTQGKLLAKSGDTIGGQTLAAIDSYQSDPAIDDFGRVYFEAQLTDGSYGIFTQSEMVVKTGDAVDGKTLAGISEMVANKLGAIAFTAAFTDGSQAIVLAQPSFPRLRP